jgi:hypothetical protein
MPSTYREIISQIRLNLLEPHPARPSEPVIWNSLRQNARLLFNQALNTPVNWSTLSYDLDVNENDDIYLLPAPNFGKDVLVHTVDETDPNHVERPIRRMSLQSSLLGGHEPYATGWGDFSETSGNKHAAQTFVFFREGGAVKIKVLGKHGQTAQYRIWYEAVDPNTDALDNFFPIAAGQDLLCLSTALSCLPGAEWPGMTKQERADRRRELGATLANSVKAHDDQYRRYIATDRQAGLTVMRGFDDSSYMDG